MASFFAVEGTVTSIGDLRHGKSGKNYIRLELKINTNEILPAIAFEQIAEKINKEVHVGTYVVISGSVHGTKGNLNARYFDVSLYISHLVSLGHQEQTERSTNKRTNNSVYRNNNTTANSSFANSKNDESTNNVTQELAKREHKLEEKANSTSRENNASTYVKSVKNNANLIEKGNKNSKISKMQSVDNAKDTLNNIDDESSSLFSSDSVKPNNQKSTDEPNSPSNADYYNFDFNFEDNDSFFK